MHERNAADSEQSTCHASYTAGMMEIDGHAESRRARHEGGREWADICSRHAAVMQRVRPEQKAALQGFIGTDGQNPRFRNTTARAQITQQCQGLPQDQNLQSHRVDGPAASPALCCCGPDTLAHHLPQPHLLSRRGGQLGRKGHMPSPSKQLLSGQDGKLRKELHAKL